MLKRTNLIYITRFAFENHTGYRRIYSKIGALPIDTKIEKISPINPRNEFYFQRTLIKKKGLYIGVSPVAPW
jgi:hypothetical protein